MRGRQFLNHDLVRTGQRRRSRFTGADCLSGSVEENIRRMIAIAGGPERLRPHVKTHKMSEIVRLQLRAGIRRVKCATLAEAEMSARAGAADVLLAQQPVGPKIAKLLALTNRYPATRFSAIVDDRAASARLSDTFAAAGKRLDVLLDLDVGMGRTGIRPGPQAKALYGDLARMKGLVPAVCTPTTATFTIVRRRRREACEAAFAPVEAFRADLQASGLDVSGSDRRRHADVSLSRRTSRPAIEPRNLFALGCRLCPTLSGSRFSPSGRGAQSRDQPAGGRPLVSRPGPQSRGGRPDRNTRRLARPARR